jgi:hypothetical protein
MEPRKYIKESITFLLNERDDGDKIGYLNDIVNRIIGEHKKNLKRALTIDGDIISDKELKNMIFKVVNYEPIYDVVFSYTDSNYGGEVMKLNGIPTIMIYDAGYFDFLNDFYHAVSYNRNKRKAYKDIPDLSSHTKIKSTLFHELVHIYDFINHDDTKKINKKLNKSIRKNEGDIDNIYHDIYSNRTTEYNAFFLQRANSYQDKNGDFGDFKEYMIDIPIYQYMDDNLKRKYLKRVYSYFYEFLNKNK